MEKVEFSVGESDGEDPIQVELTFDRVVCSRHGEPFRSGWPSGFPTLSIAIFEDLTHRRGIRRDRWQAHGAHQCSSFIARPSVQRMAKATLLGAYVQSDVGTSAVCDVCDLEGLGTPYRTQQQVYGHMCFECVIYGLAPLN